MSENELNKFQIELALEQAEWRGGVTNELENISVALKKIESRIEILSDIQLKIRIKTYGIATSFAVAVVLIMKLAFKV
jgi:archaellum component FlaC